MRIQTLHERINPEKTAEKYGIELRRKIIHDDTTPEWLVSLTSNDHGMMEIVNYIADNIDPTPTHDYTLWIIQKYIKGYADNGIRYWDDMSKVNHFLSLFDRLKRKRKFKEKYSSDINQYKTLSDLGQAVLDFQEEAVSKRGEEKALITNNEAIILYNSNDLKIVIPKTEKASCYYGRNTQWCTTSEYAENYFEKYNREGPLYIIIDKVSNERFQLHFPTEQYMNENDESIRLIKLILLYPQLVDVIPNIEIENDVFKITIIKNVNSNKTKFVYYKNVADNFHRENGPAFIETSKDNKKIVYYKYGTIHRENGPAEIEYKDSYHYTIKYVNHGRIHRENGPAIIVRDGKNYYELRWFSNGVLHREDGPALETPRYKEWYNKGQKKREDDKPTKVYKDGKLLWHESGNISKVYVPDKTQNNNGYLAFFNDYSLHRTDGPAKIYEDGTLIWYYKNEKHRDPYVGPAVIFSEDNFEDYLYGKKIDFNEWLNDYKEALEDEHYNEALADEQIKELLMIRKKQIKEDIKKYRKEIAEHKSKK